MWKVSNKVEYTRFSLTKEITILNAFISSKHCRKWSCLSRLSWGLIWPIISCCSPAAENRLITRDKYFQTRDKIHWYEPWMITVSTISQSSWSDNTTSENYTHKNKDRHSIKVPQQSIVYCYLASRSFTQPSFTIHSLKMLFWDRKGTAWQLIVQPDLR